MRVNKCLSGESINWDLDPTEQAVDVERCRIYGTAHDKSPAYFKRVIRKKGPDVIILHKPRSALYKDYWPNYNRVVANSTGKQCASYALSSSVA